MKRIKAALGVLAIFAAIVGAGSMAHVLAGGPVVQGAGLAADVGPLTGTPFVNAVLLDWESLNELTIIGYHIERAPASDGPWTRLNPDLIKGEKTGSPEGFSYEFPDADVEPGDVYYYRLVALSTSWSPYYHKTIRVVVPTIGVPYEPVVPPLPAAVHFVFMPMVYK